MNTDFTRSALPAVTDVYTDLNGLQNLKVEKNNEVALKKVSEQFESMFINMLMKNMRAANQVFSEGNMFDSQESKFYRDMHDQQLSLSLAHGRGFGIADAMYRQLSNAYGVGDSPRTREVQLEPQTPSQTTAKNTPVPASIEESPMLEMSKLLLNNKVTDNQTASESATNSDSDPIDTKRSRIADSPEDFISKVLAGAKKAAEALGVEPEVLVAQAALETGWGKKVFAQESGESTFNLFNIKADQRWQGDRVSTDTLEFLGGKFSAVAAQFRSYSSIQDSFDDFTQFISNNGRYQQALDNNSGGLDFIEGIHKAGYATDPSYVDKIASVYQRVKQVLETHTSNLSSNPSSNASSNGAD